MHATTTTTNSTRRSTTATHDRSGLRVSRWFAAAALSARPEPRAVALRRDELNDEQDNEKHEGQGGWHASSLDLAAGLQVWEPERAEAEELLRRHFHHHHYGVRTAVQ